jgi:uncharacterized membrane protein YdbT with pleckstrin-like domain
VASYVESTLISDEHVVHEASISVWCLVPHILGGLLLLPVLGLGIVIWVRAAIIYWTTELAVTNKRVIAKTGLVQRNTVEMFLSKVESVHVEQTVTGRVFNYGTVVISGTGIQSASFNRISDPLGFRKAFMTAADTAAAHANNLTREEPNDHGGDPIPGTAADSALRTRSLDERLAELKRLYETGLITEDVYKEEQRKAIGA